MVSLLFNIDLFSFLLKLEPKFFVIQQSNIAMMLIIRGQFTEISFFRRRFFALVSLPS